MSDVSGTRPYGSPATEKVMEEVTANVEEVETREDIEQILSGALNEEPVEAVKMKKPRAKAKPKEPTITKEDIMEAVKEATKKITRKKPGRKSKK